MMSLDYMNCLKETIFDKKDVLGLHWYMCDCDFKNRNSSGAHDILNIVDDIRKGYLAVSYYNTFCIVRIFLDEIANRKEFDELTQISIKYIQFDFL